MTSRTATRRGRTARRCSPSTRTTSTTPPAPGSCTTTPPSSTASTRDGDALVNADTYVIIPVFNEASVIADVLGPVLRQFSNVVCVDDGSDDGSSEIIERAGA